MPNEKSPAAVDRRGFLKAVGSGTVGATAAAAVVALPETAAASESAADKKKARYQASSAHVQAYYRTNRY